VTPESGIRVFGAGEVLGERYRLERRIATGGMATVWLGRDEELDRPVAVKVLSDVLAEDPSYVERFRREARLAAGLSHPNLVRMYDFSSESERPYLVMEYIEGGTLAERVAAERSPELDERLLAQQLLGALASIHGAGVVHRDVKPSNVLLDRDDRARLTDFGIAQPEDATRITRTGEVIGTLKYMAPEVREGEPATERSDLYSCGVLLGECLGRGGAPEVVALVERLSEEDPIERPASARHALTLLETAPTAATAPAAGPPPPARRRREIEINGRRVLAVAAALAVGGLLAALAFGGGSDSGSGSHAGAQQSKSPPTTTLTQTTTSTTTAPAPAPAAPAPAPKAKEPPKPPDEKVPPGQAKKGKGD
jgi:serine/threonine protein kinase